MCGLFALSFASDLTVGAAVAAVFCGVVLMGGRSLVGRPLRMLSGFRARAKLAGRIRTPTTHPVEPWAEQPIRRP